MDDKRGREDIPKEKKSPKKNVESISKANDTIIVEEEMHKGMG